MLKPERLINPENVDFLIGGRHYIDLPNLAEAVEQGLQWYSQHNDIYAIATGRQREAPVLAVHLVHRNDGSVGIDITQTEATSGFGILGPQMTIVEIRRGKPWTRLCFGIQHSMWCAPQIRGKHSIYAHCFGEGEEAGLIGGPGRDNYCGRTSRLPATRWREHFTAASRGSNNRFHACIRQAHEHLGITHYVLACGLSLDESMRYEEAAVNVFSLAPFGLNMIPGGYAGQQWFAKHGLQLSPHELEYSERHVRELIQKCEREGKPNPLAAMAWLSDAFAANVICNNARNYSLGDIEIIRRLSRAGLNAESISERLGSRRARVQRLLSGRTYRRIK